METSWRRRERQTKTRESSNEFERFGGGGGSRSATILKLSNDVENSIRSIGRKRQKAPVQVQNKYSKSAAASSDSQSHDLTEADTCARGRRSGARFFCKSEWRSLLGAGVYTTSATVIGPSTRSERRS